MIILGDKTLSHNQVNTCCWWTFGHEPVSLGNKFYRTHAVVSRCVITER